MIYIGKRLIVEENNVTVVNLASRDKVVLPLLHIKLGLMKQVYKSLRKDEECLKMLVQIFLSCLMPN